MTSPSRRDVRSESDEIVVLERFLDYQRDSVIRKVRDLDRDTAMRSLVDSATTLLGIVKHLTDVERWWFGSVFAGDKLDFDWSDDDPDADWRIEPGDTVDSVVTAYEAACARSREVVDGHGPLDTAAKPRSSHITLRWILVHMIEETARHAGHADILRELTDGSVGE